MTYIELKQKHQKEFDNFEGIFYAFGKDQFKEGMKKLGLNENETEKIVSTGYGGYLLKDRLKEYKEMFKRFEEERLKARECDKYLYEMFRYELANHEYCITYDYSDTLDSLGLTFEDIENDTRLKNALLKAKKDYLASVEY